MAEDPTSKIEHTNQHSNLEQITVQKYLTSGKNVAWTAITVVLLLSTFYIFSRIYSSFRLPKITKISGRVVSVDYSKDYAKVIFESKDGRNYKIGVFDATETLAECEKGEKIMVKGYSFGKNKEGVYPIIYINDIVDACK